MMDDTFPCPTRLRDIDPRTGYLFLAYPRGREIDRATFARLSVLDINAKAVEDVRAPKPPDPEPELPRGIDAMTKAQMLVVAKSLGFGASSKSTKDELAEMLRDAEADAKLAELENPVASAGED